MGRVDIEYISSVTGVYYKSEIKRYNDNIKTTEKAMPQAVTTGGIYITLGSPWIPADVIDGFIVYLFGKPLNKYCYDNFCGTKFRKNTILFMTR